jgi:hypothetical protein
MTRSKNLKRLVRERMQKTGERYAAARRQVVAQATQPLVEGSARWHLPGNIPATTALRIALGAAGVRNPASGEPFSEAMLFGIAGGIGAGVFAFYYEEEDFSSFFVAGRHRWDDDLAYLQAAAQRLGLRPTVTETGGRRAAGEQLLEVLNSDRPAIAWVDAAVLPHRAMPESHQGGGYHVVTVYSSDDDSVVIGDLTDHPIEVPSAVFADARARIKKFKNRVMSLQPASGAVPDLQSLVRSGMKQCDESMRKARMKNFTLEAFKTWADRMHGSSGKESWDRIFPRGARLWRGLTSVYDFIEHYGTGGGLMRPLYAEFLEEAAQTLDDHSLRALAEQYGELGRLWSELADAALPDDVPELGRAKRLLAEKAEAMVSGGDDATAKIKDIWAQLEDLRVAARDSFPLSDDQCLDLRASLQQRILDIYEKENAALDAVADAVK